MFIVTQSYSGTATEGYLWSDVIPCDGAIEIASSDFDSWSEDGHHVQLTTLEYAE